MGRVGNFALCAAAAAVVALTAGCSNPASGASSQAVVEGEKGTIQVTLPAAGSRGLVDIAFAKANVNYYDLLVYNGVGAIYAKANLASGGSLEVPSGTYTVVVLAGSKYDASSADLYGTGYKTGVVVASGATTNVDISLTNSTFNITAPTTVALGASYTITVDGNTGCPYVVFLQNVMFKGSDTTPLASSASTLMKQAWSISYSQTAPATTGSVTYNWGQGYTGIIQLYDASSLGASTVQIGTRTGVYWNTPESGNTDAAVSAYCKPTVNFRNPQVGVTLTWGSGQ
jgi:hypothetical protein